MDTLTEKLKSLDRNWKFDSRSKEEHGQRLCYVFFIGEHSDRAVALSTLHLDAAITTLAELVDDHTVEEKIVVKLMPEDQAKAAFRLKT